MNTLSIKPKLLSLAVASVLGCSTFASVAQVTEEEKSSMTNASEEIEVITVSGIRGSLARSMDIKRESSGVVDAISAEDIGKMPDTNLAESLQRITGVSIDRSNGEGSRVTVRGFGPDFNLVLLNGRQMPAANIAATSASSSRSYDFANLASESVSGVEVYKTSRAKDTSGGIGSVINILTGRPLDNPGMTLSVGAKAMHDKSTNDGDSVTPELSGIYSETFADDTFGVALTGSYSSRDSGYNTAETSSGWYTIPGGQGDWGSISPDDPNWNNPPQVGDVYAVPRNLLYSINDVTRDRLNAQLTLQWRPIESITATLDYTYADLKVEQKRNELATWFNGVPVGGAFTMGNQQEGSVVAPIIYSDATCCDVTLGVASFKTKNENKSLGANVEWEVSENLILDLDFHSSSAEAGPDGKYGSNNIVSPVQFDRVKTTVDYSKDFPVSTIEFVDGVSGLDPSRVSTSGSSFRNSYMKSEIDQIQFNGMYVFDDGIVESINFGAAYNKVKNRSAFANAQRDTWGGYGNPEDYDDGLFTVKNLKGKFDNLPGSGNPNLTPYWIDSNFNDVVAAINAVAAKNGDTFPGDCGAELCASSDYTTDRRTEEKSTSAYIQANLAWEMWEMPAKLVAGMRYEDTDVDSAALVPIYDKIYWAGANEFAAQSSETNFTKLSGGYDYWLPSIDISIEPTEEVVLRAGYSHSLTRPSYNDIQGGQTINQLLRFNGGTGNSGDPNLLPFESKNIDLSAEWYYSDASYVSVGYYHKDVDNFIGNTSTEEQLFNLPHPAQGPRYAEAAAATGSDDAGVIRQYFLDQGWTDDGTSTGNIVGIDGEDPYAIFTVLKPVNAQDATIDGWEIALQHMFGESGFGTQINYTTVDGDISYDNYNTNKGEGVDNQFALLGLSDSANFVLFYDKDGLQARIAYNWRDDFLTSTFDGGGERNPVYTDDYGQWDANVSYEINEQLTVFVEGINITNEYQHLYGRTKSMVIATVQTDARYNLGVRYKF